MASLNPQDFSVSITDTSDEVTDMFCEQCKLHDNKEVSASGFCVDCTEYLCSICVVYDKRTYFKHTHLDKESMPQDFCFDKCSIHKDTLIKFYCSDCGELACKICKINKHKSCVEIEHLPKLVENIEKGPELERLNKDIDKVSEELNEAMQKLDKNMNDVSLLEEAATSSINKYKEDMKKTFKEREHAIIKHFQEKKEKILHDLMKQRAYDIRKLHEQKRKVEQNLENLTIETLMKVTDTKNRDAERLQKCLQKQKKLSTDVEILRTDIEQKTEIGQRPKLFIAMKKSEKILCQIKEDLKEINKDSEINRYSIQTKKAVLKDGSSESENEYFCCIEILKSGDAKSGQKKNATFEYEITPTRKDNKTISCTSLCIPSENQLVVGDYDNNAILHFRNLHDKMNSFTLHKMSSGPWDMTSTDENKVAITFPDQGQVKIINISKLKHRRLSSLNPLSKSEEITEEIKVGKSCCGIAISEGNFIVSYINPAKIKIMDMRGYVLTTFDKDYTNKPLFTSPIHIVLDAENTILYVSDSEENTITCMTIDGKVKSIYKPISLLQPTQMAVDGSGTPYVCGHKSDNIQVLSTEKQEMDILLQIGHGILHPASLAYCKTSNKLFVGMTKSQAIKVFKISTEE